MNNSPACLQLLCSLAPSEDQDQVSLLHFPWTAGHCWLQLWICWPHEYLWHIVCSVFCCSCVRGANEIKSHTLKRCFWSLYTTGIRWIIVVVWIHYWCFSVRNVCRSFTLLSHREPGLEDLGASWAINDTQYPRNEVCECISVCVHD